MDPLKKNFFVIVMLLFCCGCTPTVHLHGTLISEKTLSALEIGTHTKDEVADFFGPATTIAPFNENFWIYIGKKTETTAFFEPVIADQKTIVLQFDDQEVLQAIYKVDVTKAVSIVPSKGKTYTGGHDISFLQELFGSFGLFHRPTGLQE